MVIGGYAVLYHAHARFTEDIDIVLGVDIDELDNVLKVVSDNFIPSSENPEEFVKQTNVLPILEKESGIRIDLIFSFLPFERKAIEHSISTFVEDQSVNIIRADELIIYKLLAGRPRDMNDIRSIFNYQSDKLNIDKIEMHLNELSTALADKSLNKQSSGQALGDSLIKK